jgi:hypothetical protein
MRFEIQYCRREWLSVFVVAPDLDTAVKRANKKLNVSHKDVGINDGTCEMMGYHNQSVLDKTLPKN